MKIAYIIFNGITWLDFIGIYDPISQLKSLHYLPDLSWNVCSLTEVVSDNFGLKVKPDKIKNELSDYDVIIVPGGFGTRTLRFDKAFISWIKTGEKTKYKISICTGSLLLGAAGFLKNKKATTNYQEYETLKPYCKEVVKDRIDLGLYLCNKWAGKEAAQEIRKRMNYRG